MNARILLINPWIYDFAAYDLWSAPVGLLLIAAMLRQAGFQVDYLDCLDRHHPGLNRPGVKVPPTNPYDCGKFYKTFIEKPALLRDIPRRYGRYGLPLEAFDEELERLERPAAVLVTSGMTYWYPGPFEAIRRVKRRFPGVPVLLGGIYATLCYDHAKAHSGADLVCPGPAEGYLLPLLNRLLGRPEAQGPSYATLDDLPYPAFDLRHGLRSVVLHTSRGCPLRCTYCASGLLYPQGFRQRRPQAVVEEIGYWHTRYGVQDFAFYDDALLLNAPAHMHVILDGLLRAGWPCRFHAPNGLHARLIDQPLADKMFAVGFKTVRLSLETVDMRHQQELGPKVTPQEFAQAVRCLFRAGFTAREVAAYILMGLPEQPLSEVVDSIRFVHDCGVQAHVLLYSPIPGTEEWTRAVRGGWLAADADPLLHNNTIYPLLRGYVREEECQRVKDLARAGNKRLVA